MDFKDLVAYRRSHRKFLKQAVSTDDLHLILRAALMSPTSKNCRQWYFVVVDDKSLLLKISKVKNSGCSFIEGAPIAIVVCAPPCADDCWIEDAAIAAIGIQYQAAELNLGSCWVQIRGRKHADGSDANTVLQSILGLYANLEILCVIAIGHYADERKLQNEEKLKWERVVKI